jgi:hypothetical protein
MASKAYNAGGPRKAHAAAAMAVSSSMLTALSLLCDRGGSNCNGWETYYPGWMDEGTDIRYGYSALQWLPRWLRTRQVTLPCSSRACSHGS